ncbi:hypothetical protein GLOTRDRAFT_110889 [Gloeophyllum trabeum ATCC 11539]|uniref:Uncharacterized protein n=1 Tax=Gloeophyllum trabeum (strain ATCC 11539 / FP-39264 / Madison 617) TaxID=670483 RepID=S7RU41_GLOTA|nr:uncharacterized protein GLOTRDRAFT_110889 [Gloeophyllum trabeum ATCC 11539]EPQ56689.1 hypothetical protein GLOTRDRAFT_110889 [Gloeophyllum trabeum ATCC 11539]
MSTLLSFSDSYKLISDGEPVDMPCDLTYVKMGSEAGPGVCEVILLVCYCKLRWCAEQARSADERDIGMEMSFVLRRKEADAADRETEGLWSLLVVAHQMVIRVNHVPDPV